MDWVDDCYDNAYPRPDTLGINYLYADYVYETYIVTAQIAHGDVPGTAGGLATPSVDYPHDVWAQCITGNEPEMAYRNIYNEFVRKGFERLPALRESVVNANPYEIVGWCQPNRTKDPRDCYLWAIGYTEPYQGENTMGTIYFIKIVRTQKTRQPVTHQHVDWVKDTQSWEKPAPITLTPSTLITKLNFYTSDENVVFTLDYNCCSVAFKKANPQDGYSVRCVRNTGR